MYHLKHLECITMHLLLCLFIAHTVLIGTLLQPGVALQVVGQLQAYIKMSPQEKALIASSDATSAKRRSLKRVHLLHTRLHALSTALHAGEDPRGAVVAVVKKVLATCTAQLLIALFADAVDERTQNLPASAQPCDPDTAASLMLPAFISSLERQ